LKWIAVLVLVQTVLFLLSVGFLYWQVDHFGKTLLRLQQVPPVQSTIAQENVKVVDYLTSMQTHCNKFLVKTKAKLFVLLNVMNCKCNIRMFFVKL
jgi:hypothetical protein